MNRVIENVRSTFKKMRWSSLENKFSESDYRIFLKPRPTDAFNHPIISRQPPSYCKRRNRRRKL